MNNTPTMPENERTEKPVGGLRRGWTTGACATAASKAALTALLTGEFPDPVSIRLPKGEEPAFPLAIENRSDDWAEVGIIKDAGDDPDVTHGATIIVRISRLASGSGIVFAAGDGVGIVTKPGLPVGVGEPAINPVPRQMMTEVINAICEAHGIAADIEVRISVPHGEEIAQQTWNPRLGIAGGISILGTTGIVHPFSCAAWIHSIHRGIDVARATGVTHVLGATGSVSEKAAMDHYKLAEGAALDMGDFAGGLLKYIRQHPVARLTIAGGFAKMVKLAQGSLDLHSSRSEVDFNFLLSQIEPQLLTDDIKSAILNANTALEVLEKTQPSGIDLPARIASLARQQAQNVLRDAPIKVDVMVTDRTGNILAIAG